MKVVAVLMLGHPLIGRCSQSKLRNLDLEIECSIVLCLGQFVQAESVTDSVTVELSMRADLQCVVE